MANKGKKQKDARDRYRRPRAPPLEFTGEYQSPGLEKRPEAPPLNLGGPKAPGLEEKQTDRSQTESGKKLPVGYPSNDEIEFARLAKNVNTLVGWLIDPRIDIRRRYRVGLELQEIELDDKQKQELLGVLRDRDGNRLHGVVLYLRRKPCAEAVSPLGELLKKEDLDPSIRMAALHALGNAFKAGYAQEEALEAICSVVRDPLFKREDRPVVTLLLSLDLSAATQDDKS